MYVVTFGRKTPLDSLEFFHTVIGYGYLIWKNLTVMNIIKYLKIYVMLGHVRVS